MGNTSYSLSYAEFAPLAVFGTRRSMKNKGCAVRLEYEKWSAISRKAQEQGISMDCYNKIMYGYRCPLMKKAAIPNREKQEPH